MEELYKDESKGIPASSQSTHRLLYRGALSLPDSHLLLDGLSFTASLGAAALNAPKTKDANNDLFNHPLALALESMRGRPSLHLVGTVEMSKLWVDEKSAGVVQLYVLAWLHRLLRLTLHSDIHPKATLSRLYFENTFCLEPITSPTGRSTYGVRISLSDTGMQTTLTTTSNLDALSGDSNTDDDILVYAQLDSATSDVFSDPFTPPSTSTSTPQCLRLLVARILPGPPPPPVVTRPRPDDPTPRVPTLPTPASAKRKRDSSPPARDKKSRLSTGKERETHDAEALRRARETMTRLPKATSAPAVPKATKEGKQVEFKVPSLPSHAKARQPSEGREASESPVDAFSSAVLAGGEFATLSEDQKKKTNKTVCPECRHICGAYSPLCVGRQTGSGAMLVGPFDHEAASRIP